MSFQNIITIIGLITALLNFFSNGYIHPQYQGLRDCKSPPSQKIIIKLEKAYQDKTIDNEDNVQ